MQSHKNNIIVASAGGRKTTLIVEKALKKKEEILIITYTIDNLDQIYTYIIEKNGCIPSNMTLLSWFTFLLRDCVRPYQTCLLGDKRVRSIDFESIPPRGIRKENPAYFINRANNIYRDRVSDFVYQCNAASDGLVIKRLEKIFDHIYIDEMQDLSGWDQNFVELLLDSSIGITLVGDPRQATYSTNYSQKNKAIKGGNMVSWIEKLIQKNKCFLEERTECYRCNQKICDFADNLYPDLPKTISMSIKKTGHDGIFFIKPDEVPDYIARHNPKVLRWWKISNTQGYPALNFGASKGRTFCRVLIFPTTPMKDYLKSKDVNKIKAGALSKFYVAVTRARHSVAFVVD